MRITVRLFSFWFIFSALLFFTINRIIFLPAIINTLSSSLLYPFLRIQHGIVQPFRTYFAHKQSKEILEIELSKVSQEREALLAEVIQLRASKNFSQETEELRQFSERYAEYKKTLVHIMLRQFSDKNHFYLVDAGSNKNIEKDMVAVYQNCLIGRVIEVYPYYSKIMLITDRHCKIAAQCAETKVCGIHQGLQDDHVTSLEYVSHLQTLQKNDLVLSSGEGLIFPQGFALGKIKDFESDGIQYRVHLAPLLDLRAINYCYLLKK